jgi:phage virion morphogenesis protein
MLAVGINTESASRQLKALLLDPQKRRRIMRGAGRKVRRDSKKRISTQKDLSGRAWKGRSNGKSARMMRKLGKQMVVKTTENNGQITFKGFAAQIARAQQDGVTQKVTAKKAAKPFSDSDTAPASKRIARLLRNEGYKVRRNKGKGWKKPSISWITSNLSRKEAMAMLHTLRGERKGEKQSWNVELPERSFLGQNESEYKQLRNFVLDEAFRLN